MLVEPFANEQMADNLNPVGRLFYGASTLICTPDSLCQEVGLAFGAQAGDAQLKRSEQPASRASAGRPRRHSTSSLRCVRKGRAGLVENNVPLGSRAEWAEGRLTLPWPAGDNRWRRPRR